MIWEALFQGAVDEDQGLVVGGGAASGDGGGHWGAGGLGGEILEVKMDKKRTLVLGCWPTLYMAPKVLLSLSKNL